MCSKKLSNEKLNKKKKKSIFKEFKTTTISTSTTISQKSTLIQLKKQTSKILKNKIKKKYSEILKMFLK